MLSVLFSQLRLSRKEGLRPPTHQDDVGSSVESRVSVAAVCLAPAALDEPLSASFRQLVGERSLSDGSSGKVDQ